MMPLRPSLRRLEVPQRVHRLPRDPHGNPIPWFVHRVGAVPDYKIIDTGKLHTAVTLSLCWVCGETLLQRKAFIVGPAACVHRITNDPPMHPGCALFAIQACPHIRDTRALWTTHQHRALCIDGNTLFRFFSPIEVRWFCGGLPAQRAVVLDAMKQALPALLDVAREDGQDAVNALLMQIKIAGQYLPPGEGVYAQDTIAGSAT